MKATTKKTTRAGAAKARKPRPAPKPEDTNADMPDANNGSRATLVGLSVLQAIARERRPMPLRDVALASGLTASRVHRYVSSLVAAGFVQQDPASGHYALGEAVIELGLLALGQLDPMRIGIEALVACSEATAADCHLSVWGTFGPTVVRWQSGKDGHQFRIEEGRVLPILWSATGRALMAHRDIGELWPLLQQEISVWNKANPDRRITRRLLEQMCKEIRNHGLSASMPGIDESHIFEPEFPRTYRLEIGTVAVPIMDHLGRAPMALTVFTTDPDKPYRKLIDDARHAAYSASRRLGAHD